MTHVVISLRGQLDIQRQALKKEKEEKRQDKVINKALEEVKKDTTKKKPKKL
jgi:hypothetical protein